MNRAILALCILLTGCAIDPARVAGATDNHVCMAYGQFRQSSAWAANAEAMRKELEARQLLTQAEWDAVNRQSLRLGMSLCAMYASMGMPSRENQHVNSAGVMTQHVYRRGSDAVYVYTRNGRVISWQQ